MHSAYTHTYALCGYTRHLRTCRYAATHANRPSGISQAAAIAVNRTQGIEIIIDRLYLEFTVYMYMYMYYKAGDILLTHCGVATVCMVV